MAMAQPDIVISVRDLWSASAVRSCSITCRSTYGAARSWTGRRLGRRQDRAAAHDYRPDPQAPRPHRNHGQRPRHPQARPRRAPWSAAGACCSSKARCFPRLRCARTSSSRCAKTSICRKGLMDELANAKLEMVGLSADDGSKFPSELSGGMTKRAALARAPRARPGNFVPRRADLGPRPDFGRRLRLPHQDLAENAQLHRLHGDARSLQPGWSATASPRWPTARSSPSAGRGSDRVAAPLGQILFSRQTRPRHRARRKLNRESRLHHGRGCIMETRAPYALVGPARGRRHRARSSASSTGLNNTGGLTKRTNYDISV